MKFPFVGGSEGLWEVTANGEGVSELAPGDLAVPAAPGNVLADVLAPGEEAGTWRTTATLPEEALVKVPTGGGARERVGGGSAPGGRVGAELAVAAHCSSSVATAIRVLEDFAEKELGTGDRVVFTGASSAVAQVTECVFRAVPWTTSKRPGGEVGPFLLAGPPQLRGMRLERERALLCGEVRAGSRNST